MPLLGGNIKSHCAIFYIPFLLSMTNGILNDNFFYSLCPQVRQTWKKQLLLDDYAE